MLQQILKFYFILTIIPLTWTTHTPQLATLEDFPDNRSELPLVKVENKYYFFGQFKVNWYEAFLICRSMDAFLASYNSPQELSTLSKYLIANYPLDHWWWLSGTDQQLEGDFFWFSTGKRIFYADWSAGQPDNNGGNENCVHLWYKERKYQMNDWVCNRLAYYICDLEKRNNNNTDSSTT
ncbi:C-type lectin 37Db-like [Lucilia sericata]|uniref:C-type lectin 37Db-like n=1 Tax=Lucilia sericata TaxID=13632 RepID=UPI0018A8140E|nr:C-type lectin 37Db-like [Lucilia sericata]